MAAFIVIGDGAAITEKEAYGLLKLLPGLRAGTLEAMERAVIEYQLERCDTFTEAAEALGISTKTLWEKRKLYGLTE